MLNNFSTYLISFVLVCGFGLNTNQTDLSIVLPNKLIKQKELLGEWQITYMASTRGRTSFNKDVLLLYRFMPNNELEYLNNGARNIGSWKIVSNKEISFHFLDKEKTFTIIEFDKKLGRLYLKYNQGTSFLTMLKIK